MSRLLASRRLSEAVPRPRGRGRALRQQCLEKDIPYDLLGQLAAANLLKDVELWQAMPLEELLEVCLQQGLETQSDREDLELRLKQMRLWRLLPLEALQDLCKKEASHVVAQMSKEKEGALSREELVEALSVANWGGQTSRQLIRKRCEEKGIPEEKLEDRSRAEQVLQEQLGLEGAYELIPFQSIFNDFQSFSLSLGCLGGDFVPGTGSNSLRCRGLNAWRSS